MRLSWIIALVLVGCGYPDVDEVFGEGTTPAAPTGSGGGGAGSGSGGGAVAHGSGGQGSGGLPPARAGLGGALHSSALHRPEPGMSHSGTALSTASADRRADSTAV